MLDKLKNTAKQTFIYSLGNISSKLIGFILLPLYTGYLETKEYGIFAILEVTSLILVTVLSFRLPTSMMRWCSNESSESKIKSILFTTYFSSVIIVIILNLLLQPFRATFSALFFGNHNYGNFFLILFLSVSFEILNLFYFSFVRLKEKPLSFVSISILRLLIVLFLNIYFVKYQHYGVKGILISQLIGHILVFIITLPVMIKNMSFMFNFSELKQMIKYGVPLVFSAIAMMILTMSDRYLIKYYLDYSYVGIYSLGYKIAGVINLLIIQSFQTGFLPIAYNNYNKPGAQRFFSKALTYYILILVLSSLTLSVFAVELIGILSKNVEYNIAHTIVPFIALSFVFQGMKFIFSLSLHFVKKTKYNAYVVLAAAIINVILNIILIPKFGIYGAASSTIASWIFMSILFYRYSQKNFPVKYEIRKIILLISIGVVLYISSTLFDDFSIYPRIFLKIGLIIIFPLVLWIFRFYEKIEIETVKTFLAKFKIGKKSNPNN